MTDLAQSKRSEYVKQAVETGVENWRGGQTGQPEGLHNSRPRRTLEEVLTTIPRREIRLQQVDDVSLPVLVSDAFKTSLPRAVSRLFVWLFMLLNFVTGTVWDWLRRKDSEQRRAVRLRRTFERAGGTIVKFGQQMAMRIDLLPWAYTVELSKMLDQIPPFPVKQALETIERSTGKKWEEIFSVFDPEPIGSASIACVYQAIMRTGEKVAVKVRRPKIGELFMADFKAFDWLMNLVEFFTILRPGYTENIRSEFKTILLEELDFVQEARFQEMFRRNAKDSGKKFFTAPKLIPEYCNQELIVQEYTEGIWLYEIMAGVEQQNPEALARMQELNIDPKIVAKRLLWVNYWGMQENLFFHADPHPANVIVTQNSRLTFIDFGSCGSFNREQRAGLELTAIASGQNDAEGMARGTLKLFEPLPPVDVKEMFQEAEAEYTKVLAIFRSKFQHTEWWERTSVRQWMSFFSFSRKNNIPVTLHTLRMIRATLLYDTIAVRISKEVDRFEEYLKFKKFRESRAKQRVVDGIKDQFTNGLDNSIYLWLEEANNMSEKLMYRVQATLDTPIFNFSSLIGKGFFAATQLIKSIGQIVIFTFICAGIIFFSEALEGTILHTRALWEMLAGSRVYLGGLVLLAIINFRQISFRLRDQDH